MSELNEKTQENSERVFETIEKSELITAKGQNGDSQSQKIANQEEIASEQQIGKMQSEKMATPQKKRKITSAYLAKTAILSALSFILYMFVKFPLPFIFPSFLEMNISELPAILAGFGMGPLSGAIVIVIRTALKLPFTTTSFVGELTDLVLGLCYVLPASILYLKYKNKKFALLGLIVGSAFSTIMAILLNRFVSIPFYTEYFFGGNFEVIVNICRALYKNITAQNFYSIYLFAAVLPFNILRLTIVSFLTFLLYKKLSKILHFEFKKSAK